MLLPYWIPRSWVPVPQGAGLVEVGLVVSMDAPWMSLVKLVDKTCASPESDSRLETLGEMLRMERSAVTSPPRMMGMMATTTSNSINVKPSSLPWCTARWNEGAPKRRLAIPEFVDFATLRRFAKFSLPRADRLRLWIRVINVQYLVGKSPPYL